MPIADIISLIDDYLTRLQQVRELLDDSPVSARPQKTAKAAKVKAKVEVSKAAAPEREPEPIVAAAPVVVTTIPSKKKRTRTLSEEGRRRIQEAQRQRWAERRNGESETDKEEAKAVSPLTPSALTRSVPTGPVAVSAEEARKAEHRRAQLEAVPHPEPTISFKADPKLTFESLFKDMGESSEPAPEPTPSVI